MQCRFAIMREQNSNPKTGIQPAMRLRTLRRLRLGFCLVPLVLTLAAAAQTRRNAEAGLRISVNVAPVVLNRSMTPQPIRQHGLITFNIHPETPPFERRLESKIIKSSMSRGWSTHPSRLALTDRRDIDSEYVLETTVVVPR